MINGKMVSIGSIIWRVLRNPLASDLSPDYAAELAFDFLKLMSSPLALSDKTEVLEVYEYKTKLPENAVNLKGISFIGEDKCENFDIPLRYASDVYHVNNKNCVDEYTYVLQECNIITSFNKGFVKVSFEEVATDEEGFPLIPDNESFKKALEYHILFKYIEPLWSIGKITDKVFSYYDTQAMWYFGQAENSLRLANIDHLETTMNAINRLIVSATAHSDSFKNLGEKEIIKKYW